MDREEANGMSLHICSDRISVSIPKRERSRKMIEQLTEIAEKRDRTVNYLVVEAILEYLDREESGS